MVDFGETLKKLRLQEGFTQQQLAYKLGVTKSVVSYYELQERYPSPDILIKIASIFHVSTNYLLGIERGSDYIDLTGLCADDIIIIKRLVASLREKSCKKAVSN